MRRPPLRTAARSPSAEKVVANKPAGLVSGCGISGAFVTDLAACDARYPYFREPRTFERHVAEKKPHRPRLGDLLDLAEITRSAAPVADAAAERGASKEAAGQMMGGSGGAQALDSLVEMKADGALDPPARDHRVNRSAPTVPSASPILARPIVSVSRAISSSQRSALTHSKVWLARSRAVDGLR